MKTRKNLFVAALLVASAAMTGCSGELAQTDTPVGAQSDVVSYRVSIPATKGSGVVTRGLSLDDNTLTPYWADVDVVYVYDSNDNLVSETPLTPATTGTTVTTTNLTGTLSREGGFSADETLTLYFLKDKDSHGNYSGQAGTIDDIQANFDYATAPVTVESVFGESNDNILTTSNATFTHNQAVTKFSFTYGGSAKEISSLTIAATGLVNDGTTDGSLSLTGLSASDVWVAMHNTSGSSQTYIFTATDADDVTYTATKSVNLLDNKYYVTTIALAKNLTATVTIPAQDYTGEVLTPVITVKDGEADLTVDEDYEVTLPEGRINAGNYDVTITFKGNYAGTATETFTINPGTTTITATGITNGVTILTAGAAATAIGAVSSLDPTGVAFTYVSSNESVATVDVDGNITPVAPGTVTITVNATGSNIANASQPFNIAVRQAGINGGMGTIETSTTGGWE